MSFASACSAKSIMAFVHPYFLCKIYLFKLWLQFTLLVSQVAKSISFPTTNLYVCHQCSQWRCVVNLWLTGFLWEKPWTLKIKFNLSKFIKSCELGIYLQLHFLQSNTSYEKIMLPYIKGKTMSHTLIHGKDCNSDYVGQIGRRLTEYIHEHHLEIRRQMKTADCEKRGYLRNAPVLLVPLGFLPSQHSNYWV